MWCIWSLEIHFLAQWKCFVFLTMCLNMAFLFVYKLLCGLYLSGFVTYKSFNMGQWLEGWVVHVTFSIFHNVLIM